MAAVGWAGDSKRIKEIRRVVERAVSATCPRSLGHLRDDIVQGAMLRIARAASSSDDKLRTRAYLWKVAHSAIHDELRTARRRQPETLADAGEIDARRASSRPGPESTTRAREIARAIEQCLSEMIQPRRRVVTLNLLGFDLAEIASVLHEDKKRVDNLLYRGLANLRSCLEDKAVAP